MTPLVWMFGSAGPLSTASAAAPTCDLADAPSDERFRVPVEGERVRLVLEVWPTGADPAWAPALLDVAEARGLSVVVAVPAAPPDPAATAALARVAAGDHEVAVVIGRGMVPADSAGVQALEQAVAPVRDQVRRVRTVVAPVGSRGREALLGRAGFRTLLDANPGGGAAPRMAGHFEGQQRTHVVLPSGPYEGPCGPTAVAGPPFTPAAADRIGQALQRAARTPGTPVVRASLEGRGGSLEDAAVLGRWLDEIVGPGGVRVVTADQARLDALRAFRKPVVSEDLPEVGGRLIALEEIDEAARSLAEAVPVLPRALPGELNPTESYYAFALLLAERTEGAVVRLGALHGPAQLAASTLPGDVTIPRAVVVSLARALVSSMPTEVPAALPVGTHSLTASEVLLALASAVRGDDPVRVNRVDPPEPNERGLGWGDATVP